MLFGKRKKKKKWIEQAIFFEEGSDKFQGWRGNFKIDENNRELVNQSRENMRKYSPSANFKLLNLRN